MIIYNWPTLLLSPRINDLRLMANTRSAGESITGFEQVADGITSRWMLSLSFNNLRKDAILPYRALKAKLNGRSNAVRVPIRDTWLWPSDDAIGIVNVPNRLDPWASYDDGEAVADLAGATITGSAGDKSAVVTLGTLIDDASLVVLEGMYFSAGNDLHIITSISWAGDDATIGFEPALRENKAAAAFGFRPTLLCRLADDESGRHSMDRARITAPQMELIEVLPTEAV